MVNYPALATGALSRDTKELNTFIPAKVVVDL